MRRFLVGIGVVAGLSAPAWGQNCVVDDIGNGSIGVFGDAAGTSTCLSAPPFVPTTLHVVATPNGASVGGITGAEFRFEIPGQAGYIMTWTPNPTAHTTLGSPIDPLPADPTNLFGITMAFVSCQASVIGTRLSLGTITLINLGSGAPTEITVRRKLPPSNATLNDAPVFVLCDNPTFTNVNLTPTVSILGREGVLSRSYLNTPSCQPCNPVPGVASISTLPDGSAGPLCVEPGVPTLFHLVGRVPLFSPPGVTGAAFRIEVSAPTGYVFNYTPPPGAQAVGDPVDRTPNDPADPAGVSLFFPACSPGASPQPGDAIALGTLTVFGLQQTPTTLRIRGKIPPNPSGPACPYFLGCDAPFNTPICFLPSGGNPDIAFEAVLNDVPCLPNPFTAEELDLDTHELDDGMAGPVSTSQSLHHSKTFLITVDGTLSTTSNGSWLSPPNVLCGKPEAAPMHPSPGVTNFWVGTDAETHFAVALPPGGDCATLASNGFPPHHARFLIDLGSGFEDLEPLGLVPQTPSPGHRYVYQVTGQDAPARFAWSELQTSDNYGVLHIRIEEVDPTDSPAPPAAAPRTIVVQPNAPDPFNPETTLAYTLDEAAPVVVTVVDARGRLVRRLFSGNQVRGDHRLTWNGRRDDGTRAPSGVYFARIWTPGARGSERMTLVK